MAYNPFNFFRKYQKAIFVVLTVMCMIVFIAQFGAGDVFTRAMAYFGSGRELGTNVTTLNGKRVSEGELSLLAQRRRLATAFLITTIPREQQAVLDDLLNKKLKTDEGKSNPLFGLSEIARNLNNNRQQREQLINTLRRPGLPQDIAQRVQFQLQIMTNQAHQMAIQALNDPNTGLVAIAGREGVKDDPDRLETLMQVGSLVGFDLWNLTRTQADEFYLGGNKQIDSLLDFVLWQQQADRLGIQLTDADLAREISREAAGAELFEPSKYSLEREKRVTDFILAARQQRDFGNVNAPELVAALREEFRVALAQSMLLGYEPGARGWRTLVGGSVSPSVGTPDEFLKFYREFRTTMRARLLPIMVETFLSQVKAEPTDDELRRLFDRHKEQEPDPAARTPGFKEPRRIKAEYVIGSIETPYYRDHGKVRADLLAEMAEPYRRAKIVLLAPALSPLGAGPLGQALAIAGPTVVDPLQSEYERYLKTTDAWAYPEFVGFQKERELQLSSVLTPGVISHTVATPGGPLAQAATLYGLGTANELRGTIRLSAARVLGMSPAGAAPGLDTLLTAVALAAPYRTPVLPPEVLRPTTLANLQKSLSRQHLAANIAELNEELGKLKGKNDASAELVTKKAKEMHLTFQRMPRALSQLALADAGRTGSAETGLTAFKEGMNRIAQRDLTLAELARILFAEQGTYAMGPRSAIATEDSPEQILFWRSEELPARLRKLPEARDDVVAAWRLEKARDLARKQALELHDRINKEKLPPADAVRLLNEAKAGETFELDNVAQYVAPKEVRPEARTEYQRYAVPESLEKQLPYPPADLPKLLMVAKRPGDAVVFLDRPGKAFYVAVVEARDEPSLSDFKKLYERSPFRDPLYDMFVARKQQEYAKAVVEQLRKEAGAKVDKDGRYDLPEAVRKRFTGQGDEF